MKRIFSMVLALVMVMTTFAMLVPNALAATEKNVEAKVLYEENFDDLNDKTAAEILAGAGMEVNAGMLDYLSVVDGRMKYGAYMTGREEYVILTNDKLTNGYTFEYDLTYIENRMTKNYDNAFSVHTHRGTGNQGWVSQIRWNGGVISGVNTSNTNGGGWSPAPATTGSTAGTGGSANAASSALKEALGVDAFTAATTIKNKLMHVKVEFDKANRTITTYVNDVMVASGTTTEAGDAYLTNELRLVVGPNLVVKVDNMKVTTMGATPEVLMNETFDSAALLAAETKEEYLDALDWDCILADATPCNGSRIRRDNGALILGRDVTGALESFTLVKNNEDVKNGFVVEYDFEFIDTTGSGTSQKGVAIHSAKVGSQSWASQFRWGKKVGSGVFSGSDFVGGLSNCDATCNSAHIQNVTPGRSDAMQKSRVAVRVVFDPQLGYVTTYAKIYTGEALTWTEADVVQKSTSLKGQESLLDGTVRLVFDSNVCIAVDNIKVTTLEKTPNVYGYQADSTNSQNIRLLGVIDNEIFTTAEKVGFRVTMTKVNGGATATKDIDCNYVYKSVTEWGADTPTTAVEMLHGASYVYALHVKGITEAVEITVVPYYVDEGVTYLGDACSTFTYDPTPAVQ